MKKIYQVSSSVLFLLSLSFSLLAQNSFFTPVSESAVSLVNSNRVIIPLKYNTVKADMDQLKNFLRTLPSEKNVTQSLAPIMQIPMPDGRMVRFRVWESSIQSPALEARYPEIRTFAGQGIDDPYANIRFDIGPRGFHAQVLTVNGTYYIDPYAVGNNTDYISYFRKDLMNNKGNWSCDVPDYTPKQTGNNIIAAACRGTEMRTYRLAVACTGEYAQAPGINAGTNPAILHAAIVTTVNRVVGVYRSELAVSMTLVATNNLVEFLDAATDPFNGNNNANVLINESQVVIDANIGSANYDIGHTFSTGGGGLAQLNSPCGSSKARGITGSPNPTGDAYDIDYVAHEMGHQFGGNHTMAGCGSSPNSTKLEVGSGTTIQAYAGICGGQDIQPNSDPFFHGMSFDEISNFVSGAGAACGTTSATGNQIPVIGALSNNGANIPISTPFTLTGSATDPDNDPLTYCWEQWDVTGTGNSNWNAGATGAPGNTLPLFKSRIPKTSGSRTFPDIAVILAGYPANPPATLGGLKGETLSPVDRPMKFKLTVRDNKATGGGVASSGADGCQTTTVYQINVIATSGPFAVTAPNGGESWAGNSSQTITWNVVGTNAAPISVANVRITLSTDGGLTYPTELLASTPNDGTQSVTMPNITTSTARIRVEAVGNVFFDISNANFSITGGTATNPTVTINQAAAQPDPTSVSPINFTVVFDQVVTGFATGDVTLAGTAGATTGTVSGSGTTYNVAVTGMTASGTVIATIPAGVCVNALAEPNLASTSTDNTVTFNLAGNNDACSGALPIACGQTITGTTVGATIDAVATCGTTLNTAPGVWYTFVGDGSIVTLSLCGSGYDTKIGVFSGTCAALVCVAGNDDFCGLQSQLSFASVNATTYYVLVTGFGTASGAFTLTRSCITPPPNDACAGAITISCGQTITGTTVGATSDAVGTCVTSLNTAPGLWYTFIGNGVSNTLSLCGSGYDTKIGVFSGTCGALVCVTGNDDFCGLQSQVTFTPTLGTTYYILVTGFSTAAGTFTLNRACAGIANDVCFEALPIACAQTISATTVGSTIDAVPTCGTTLNTAGGIWYRFTGNGANTTLSLCGSSYDTKIGVFSGTCGALVCVVGNDDFCGLQSEVTLATVIGTEYYVLVTGFGTATGAFTLARTCALPPCLPSTITPAAPAPICAGIIQQLTASSANPGNPPHIWAPVTELFTDAAATIPYTGTAVNTVYARATVTRVYTATLQSTTCTATPVSVTVTINPNPNIIITADPGTTICQGDPTLLTVVTGTSTPVSTLYTQGTGTPPNGSPSQVFEPANAAFSSQGADDFTVPAGATWTVTQVTTSGINTASGVPTSVNVFFYANSGSNLPGAAIASFTNLASFVRTGANYVVTLPGAGINLPGGTYWMSFQVNMSFATSGQWFWGNFGTTNVGNQYAWQNPGGGFATPCTSWGYGATGCGVGGTNRNNYFSIIGTSVTGGAPLPPGYTFLWSPAAGLSSTTSNPVAASPMNTTTYTVTATTPGGCTRQASILITVNQRPTVTTQPASSTNCVGNTVTFTVGGTGTGLAYQWQVSPTGCGGPWTNLTNTAPYSGVNTGTLTVTPVTQLMSGYAYRAVLTGACAPIGTANISNCAVLTVNANPNVSITPPVSCGGVAGIYGTALTVGSAPPPVPGQVSANSGTINVPIPDGTGVAATSNLTIAGIPANATITEIKVNMNINHTWVGDVDVNLRAPNNAILNLVGGLDGGTGGNSTDNFTNTAFSSIGGATISGAPAPRTGTFAAEARAGFGPIGYIQTVATWAGLVPPATPTAANGQWTLAMGDFVATDIGALTNWSITIDYTTPGGGGGPTLTYVWSPLAGLYTNSTATIPYTGGNTPIVYAAPTALTVYTVRATDVATGCFTDATAIVNYTPPAPTVTPSSVTMCLGDPAVKLKSSSSQAFSSTFNSGTLALAIPDGPASWPQTVFPGVVTPNLPVSGIPANATITGMSVKLNLTHTYIADMVIVLKAPNGQVFNLDANINKTGGAGANFINTIISSASTTPLSAGAPPYTGTFRADAVGATYVAVGFTFPGGPTSPAGYIPTVTNFNGLYSVPNGNWTLGMYDWGLGDLGTLTNWELKFDYIIGVPATPAVWSPAAGLFSDAAAAVPYVAGTAVDSVWTRPTPAGVYTYQATVQSMPVASTFTNPGNIVINASGPATPYPSNITVSGLPGSGVSVQSVILTGMSHTWGDDIDIVLQSPTGENVVLMSDVGGTVAVPNATYTFVDGAAAMNATAANPTGTYRPTNNGAADNWPAPGPGPITQAAPALSTFTGNVNGDWKLFVFDDVGGDAGSISGGYTINFNVSIPPCTSPARTVIVTVHQPTTVTTQPVNQTICTDKVATFTAAGGGSGPFSYQWQVSTNSGNPPWTNITNGGVYSGATTATLTITQPPVSMSGYHYRVIINGAAPCAAATSFSAILTVNPLPIVVISASPYTSLFPGLVTTLSSTVTPNAAATYTWLRNGVAVAGATGATLNVDIDGLGDYQLRVTDVNNCTNSSNIITIKDSVSGKCFIYPNPTSGKFQVRYYSVANNVLPRTLTIYDAKGDRVFTQYYTIGRPYDRMDVDMRAYGKGLYWVEIGDLNGNRITMCRVVIQ
ncbi:MAG: T9SS type A sorting domain-containing protein [Chitinophagaceae bacterium]|nr:T9SS type A sorting domain-containing protein [Chitinophagaceae bacterium]